jgi:FkbM family methyltransferase
MPWLSSISREVLRWYLQKFPLRDGKTFFYKALQEPLAPAARLITVTLLPGFRMKLDLQDPVQRRIYFYGDYDERYEAEMVRRLLDEGDTFWDIGANIGYFSLLAARKLNHTGRVVAFEPGRVAYERLQENIGLNPYHNITAYKLAVTDKAGEAVLYLAGETADGLASLYDSGGGDKDREACRAVSLDEFSRANNLSPPDFIKIDVEGAEWFVLKGAENLLAASPPLLLLEMKQAALAVSGTSKNDIQEFLNALGYRAAFPHRRRWYATRDVNQVKSRNILWFNAALATHREKVARLPLRGL